MFRQTLTTMANNLVAYKIGSKSKQNIPWGSFPTVLEDSFGLGCEKPAKPTPNGGSTLRYAGNEAEWFLETD